MSPGSTGTEGSKKVGPALLESTHALRLVNLILNNGFI